MFKKDNKLPELNEASFHDRQPHSRACSLHTWHLEYPGCACMEIWIRPLPINLYLQRKKPQGRNWVKIIVHNTFFTIIIQSQSLRGSDSRRHRKVHVPKGPCYFSSWFLKSYSKARKKRFAQLLTHSNFPLLSYMKHFWSSLWSPFFISFCTSWLEKKLSGV